MKTVVHISDVHFGRVNKVTVAPLVQAIHDLKPTVVVLSGDLTQRARKSQFMEAREFLDSLPKPQIVVPGNHDVPFFDLYRRFFFPIRRFKRFITDDMFPYYEDPQLAVIGINTARSFTIEHGRINEEQIAKIKERLCKVPRQTIKIIVTHHPFDLPTGYTKEHQVVKRARIAMKTLAECGADLFLAGHLHVKYSGVTVERYKIDNYAALVVQAGTAISTRKRKETNSFNVIECEYPNIAVIPHEWDEDVKRFVAKSPGRFEHSAKGWRKLEIKGTANDDAPIVETKEL